VTTHSVTVCTLPTASAAPATAVARSHLPALVLQAGLREVSVITPSPLADYPSRWPDRPGTFTTPALANDATNTFTPATAMRARDYQPGEHVPGTVYKILRLIGAGGMGTVYDVEDTTIGKRYVLKTLHPKLGAREDLVRRIQHEARTLARLHHPNIVEVITAGVTADELRLPYYLMERLSGQSLRLILEKKGQLDLPHAYHIGIDLLDALDHAHDKGVIHRDVKPDNIFLHRTMAGITVTKLLDFGIVSMLDAGSGETAGRFLGTLRYAAPEQLRGEKPSAKTDVYSAGLVLYEIAAGRGPFDDEGDSHRIAHAHMHKFPLPPSQYASVPREFDVLLMSALAKNPDARPRDAFSFAASLRNLKRRLEEARPREDTDNRVTAAAVLGPESTPGLSYVSSSPPEPRSVPLGARSSTPPPLGKTTLVGMPSPTVAPTSLKTSPNAFATTYDARDRVATTNNLATDTSPMPQHGTEALPPRWVPPIERGEGETAIQWPPERFPMLSDEPQVRSLPASSLPRRPVWPIVLAASAVVVTGLIAIRVAPHQSTALTLPSPQATAAMVVAPAAVRVSSASELIPAPTIAPPALEEPAPVGSPGLRQKAPAAPSSTRPPSNAKGAAPAAVAQPPVRRAAPAPYASDRPGPGF
jgi:eukaryotic-like serine/threonine-protein kinase